MIDLQNERSASLPKRSATSPSLPDVVSGVRPDSLPKRSEFPPTLLAIDGGNDTLKPVFLVSCLVENPSLEFHRVEKRTPKKGLLSKKKSGEQKFVYQITSPENWSLTSGRLIRDILPELSGCAVRIEPDMGSYRKDRDEIIRLARQHNVTLLVCDAKLSARQRIKFGIPKNETTDFTDAILIYSGHDHSFGKAKLMSEKKAPLFRENVKKILEISEESGWTDLLAKEALSSINATEIQEKFGEDLAQPVFIVTAYAAAKDPQCETRKDFDRFCGLFARARGRGKRGVGSVISSNLSHFNDNPQNRKAARYIFHKVKQLSGVRADLIPQRSDAAPSPDSKTEAA